MVWPYGKYNKTEILKVVGDDKQEVKIKDVKKPWQKKLVLKG